MKYENARIQPATFADKLILNHNDSGKGTSLCNDSGQDTTTNGAYEVDE